MINEIKLIEMWSDSLRHENLAPSSIDLYCSDVSKFYHYCEDRKLPFSDIELSDMREYMLYCTETQKYANATMRRFVVVIRCFMRWLEANKNIAVNVVADLRIKKTASPLPSILEIESINRLLDLPDPEKQPDLWLWIRDCAMFEVLYSSGLRVTELANLQLGDVDLNQKLVRVNSGKGRKDRIVPLGSKAKKALQRWLMHRIEATPKSDHLFLGSLGNGLSRIQIYKRIKKQAARAGLSENVYPHLLRHSFATHMLTASGDIRAVQEMLGHASLSTTQIYTHLDFDHLAETYDKAHPRSGFK